MDPVSAIVGALIAGATAAASNVATDAVKDTYTALKTILTDTYRLASTALLDKKPSSTTAQEAVKEEVQDTPAILKDQAVLEKAKALQEALSQEKPEQLAAWGVDIRKLEAVGDVIADNIRGSGGGLRADEVKSGGSIRMTNITGGSSSGN